MFTVGPSSTWARFVRASSPSARPTASTRAGEKLAASALPHGKQAAEAPPPTKPGDGVGQYL